MILTRHYYFFQLYIKIQTNKQNISPKSWSRLKAGGRGGRDFWDILIFAKFPVVLHGVL